MKLLLWAGVGLLLLLWTVGAWVVATLVGWVQQGLAAGAVAEWGAAVAGSGLPAWATWWVSPAWVMALVESATQALELAQAALPWLGTAAGLLVGLTWALWALGALLLLALAAVGHWGIGRMAGSGRAPAQV